MDKTFEQLKEYYRLIIERLKKTGLSERQKQVYSDIAGLFPGSEKAQDFQLKKEERNLDFELAKATMTDNWTAKARAAEKAGDTVTSASFQNTADKTGEAKDLDELGAIITRENSKAIEASKKQDQVIHDFTAAISTVFEFMLCDAANIKTINRLTNTLNENLASLLQNGCDLEILGKDPFYRSYFPFSDKLWEKILTCAYDLKYYKISLQAERELKDRQAAIIKEISPLQDELTKVQKEIDQRTKRRLFLGTSPKDTGGEYIFDMIWEGDYQ